MIDSISVNNDNLIINKGVGNTPTPPPSSPEINNSQSGQPAAVVELSQPVAQDSNKRSERVEKSQSDKPLEEEMKDAIASLNQKLGNVNRQILFKLDKKIDKHYISVIDKESKEIIREFPPEEIRNFIARFDEFNEKLSTSQDVKSLIINLEV